MTSDITREDMARWPDSTQVAWDWLLGQGFAPRADFPSVEVRFADVGPYEMVDRDGRPSLFGLDRPTYEAWSGAATAAPPFSVEVVERYMRMELARRHSDCPLAGCEDFDGQRLVPVAVRGPNMFDVVRDAHRMIGEPMGAESTSLAERYFEDLRHIRAPQTALQVASYLLAWMADPRAEQFRSEAARERDAQYDREAALSLAAAINAPPPTGLVSKVDLERRIITIRALESAELLRGRDVAVAISVKPKKLRGPQPGGSPDRPSRVPEKLQRVRLDGRR